MAWVVLHRAPWWLLVCKQYGRGSSQREGNHDPLSHSPTEFMRHTPETSRGMGHPDLFEELNRLRSSASSTDAIESEDFIKELTDAAHRIERRHGLLEHHRYLRPAHGPPLGTRHSGALEILDSNAALDQREPRGQKTNGRQSRHGLATARLSHKRHHLSGTDLQTGTTDNRVAVRDGLYLDRVES